MLLVGVAVLTFASLVYFAEKVIRWEEKYFTKFLFFQDNPAGSWSFLDSFWWGLMTLTTVGWVVPRLDFTCKSRIKILPAEMYFAVNQTFLVDNWQLSTFLSSWCDIASLDLWQQWETSEWSSSHLLNSLTFFTIHTTAPPSLSSCIFFNRLSRTTQTRMLDDHKKNLLFSFLSYDALDENTLFIDIQKRFYVVWAMCGWLTNH